MFRSLQWRLVGIFVSFAVALIIVVGVVLNLSVQSSYYDSFKNDIERGFSNWLIERNWDTRNMTGVSVSELVSMLSERPEERYNFRLISENRSFTLVDNTGASAGSGIYASSDKYFDKDMADKFWFMISRSVNLVSVMAGQERGDSSGLVRSDGVVFFDYAAGLNLKEGNYILYFRYDRDDWAGIINTFNSMIFMSLLAAVAAALLLGFILSRTITLPITSLMDKTKKMAEGDFDMVLGVKSQDEIGELTKSFNYMGSEIKYMMGEISSQKIRLETILKYMSDGVIAYDLEGKVMHINPAAAGIMGSDISKETFNEFSSRYGLGMAIEDIRYLDRTKGGEKVAKSGDRYIRIYYALFIDEENNVQGIVVVLHDDTEQQKLDNMRREFVGNVSHELNTPLTCIKSYSETLLDGALE
ncbi:MAG: HAMP domain-containing protein, partial [Eubacteriales bacterium]|nr:HAMP domain-containing protein [Eubacteriales bacterium]